MQICCDGSNALNFSDSEFACGFMDLVPPLFCFCAESWYLIPLVEIDARLEDEGDVRLCLRCDWVEAELGHDELLLSTADLRGSSIREHLACTELAGRMRLTPRFPKKLMKS